MKKWCYHGTTIDLNNGFGVRIMYMIDEGLDSMTDCKYREKTGDYALEVVPYKYTVKQEEIGCIGGTQYTKKTKVVDGYDDCKKFKKGYSKGNEQENFEAMNRDLYKLMVAYSEKEIEAMGFSRA